MTAVATGDRAPITVNVLTGFLGSGKTSVLNRLLRQPGLAGSAVLINEFGEIGIDHLLVEELDEDVVLLQSGCICCSIRGDLKEAMVGLHDRMRRGIVPAFDRLVVETTGLADPAPIVATLTADPVLRHHFQLGNIVTVVDAISGTVTLRDHEEAVRQAAVADRIVLSKTDLADAGAADMLGHRLAALNPTARIVRSTMDSALPAALLASDLHDREARLGEVERWVAVSRHGTRRYPHAHGTAIRSTCVVADRPLDWAAFGLWLSMLLNRHGTDILRVKGILNVEGNDAPVVIHGVQHTIHTPEHLATWPDNDTRTRIVFIMKSLDPRRIHRSFNAFVSGSPHAGAWPGASQTRSLSRWGTPVDASPGSSRPLP